MNGNTNDFDTLKARGIKERDLTMFKMRMEGKTFKDIAAHFKLKSPVSVSRRVKKIQGILASADAGIKNGNIVLEQRGGVVANRAQPGNAVGLRLPDQNPFLALNTFEDLGKISSAGGSVIGAGAAMLVEGFTREDISYADRNTMVLKGGGVTASSLLGLILTFNKFTEESRKNAEIIENQNQNSGVM